VIHLAVTRECAPLYRRRYFVRRDARGCMFVVADRRLHQRINFSMCRVRSNRSNYKAMNSPLASREPRIQGGTIEPFAPRHRVSRGMRERGPKRLEDARRATHPCLSSARERNLASGRKRGREGSPKSRVRILLGEKETRGRNEKRLGIVEVVAKHQTVCLIRDDPRADTCRRFLPPSTSLARWENGGACLSSRESGDRFHAAGNFA